MASFSSSIKKAVKSVSSSASKAAKSYSSGKSSGSSSKSSSSSSGSKAAWYQGPQEPGKMYALSSPKPSTSAISNAMKNATSFIQRGYGNALSTLGVQTPRSNYLEKYATQTQPYQTQPPQRSDLNSILSKFSSGYTYTPPSESALSAQAKQYAGLQTSPLLSAIQSRLSNAQTQYDNQKSAINAAYSMVPQQTERYLKAAEEQALQRAIRMGGGRGGEVNWFTQKMQEPVIANAQQQESERAAQLTAIANQLAEAQSGGERERQEAATRQGQLEAYRLAELRDAIRQAQLQQLAIDRETMFRTADMYRDS